MAFSLNWLSCDALQAPLVAAPHILDAGSSWLVVQGDTPYVGMAGDYYGYNTPKLSLGTTADQLYTKHLQHWAKWGWQRLRAQRLAGSLKILYQPDDHEWPGDNWDHTPAQAPTGTLSQAEVNRIWGLGNTAVLRIQSTHYDNPSPGLAGNGDRPSGALASGQNPPVSNYPVRYFHKDLDINGVEGGQHVRLICVDCLSYRSPIKAPASASKTMLGPVQRQWLIDRVLEAHQAGFAHILVASPKKLFAALPIDNGDTWDQYRNERNSILRTICAAGARVLWLSGDRHMPHVLQLSSPEIEVLDVCACPVSTSLNGVGPSERILWVGYRQAFGQLDVLADGLALRLRDANTGGDLWSCRVAPRTNLPLFPTTALTAL